MSKINVAAALKEIDVNPVHGVNRAIQTVGENITQSPDPLSYANAVIHALGGDEQLDFPTARIMAKAMVERAVTDEKYDVENAKQYAEAKVIKLRKEHPWSFTQSQTGGEATDQPAAKPKQKGRKSAVMADGKSKKACALAICDANSSLESGALATMIAKELSITYANAYYYVSRVWKRPTSK